MTSETATRVFGWLVAAGSLALPGLGPLIAAGPILATLSGAAGGQPLGWIWQLYNRLCADRGDAPLTVALGAASGTLRADSPRSKPLRERFDAA